MESGNNEITAVFKVRAADKVQKKICAPHHQISHQRRTNQNFRVKSKTCS